MRRIVLASLVIAPVVLTLGSTSASAWGRYSYGYGYGGGCGCYAPRAYYGYSSFYRPVLPLVLRATVRLRRFLPSTCVGLGWARLGWTRLGLARWKALVASDPRGHGAIPFVALSDMP